MSYPATPGYKVEGPSKDAALAMAPISGPLRLRVYDEIKASLFGLTTDECADRLGETVLAIRPRFTELAATGWIVDTGLRRKNSSGRRATVWKAVNE